MDEREKELEAIAALREPSRRALYDFVAASPSEVSRDDAAQATGLSRVLTAFHLDRLVSAGLLEATFRRVSGRSGPGAGRPSKFYRRARRAVSVSFPQRRYEMLSRLLADAVERAGDGSIRAALAETAYQLGRKLASDSEAGRHGSPQAAKVRTLLEELGFEPYEDGNVLRLRNCPFDALAKEHRELTCSTNLCLMEGVLEGLGVAPSKAQLEPVADGCCVAFPKLSA